MPILASLLRAEVAVLIRTTREALGWTQAELGRRARVSQSEICRIEKDLIKGLSFETASRILDALRIRVTINLTAPTILGGGRQHDAAHARCVAFVARRLRALGWLVETEVMIVGSSAFGWIDIAALRPGDRTLLVIEIKTELRDIGAAMRQQAWYEREARSMAQGFGWSPRRVVGALLVLATEDNVGRLAGNRDLLRDKFSLPASELGRMIAGDIGYLSAPRGLAMIDPLQRRAAWVLRSPLDGWSATPRYANYRAFMAAMRGDRAAAWKSVVAAPAELVAAPAECSQCIETGGWEHADRGSGIPMTAAPSV